MDFYSIESIDPYGCECVACDQGIHVSLDNSYITRVYRGILDGLIQPFLNLEESTSLIVYEDDTGFYRSQELYAFDGFTEYEIVTPFQDFSDTEDGKKVVFYDGTGDTLQHSLTAKNAMNSGNTFVNNTSDTLIIYGSDRQGYGIAPIKAKYRRINILCSS